MRLYSVPKWLRLLYPGAIWEYKNARNSIYLTFDDGPTKETTPWLLDLLKEYDAKATFFCVGDRLEDEYELAQRIREDGHLICNHSYSHLNGRKTKDDLFIVDILKGAEVSESSIYRPPYGKIKSSQYRKLRNEHSMQAVFWSLLSYDYDNSIPSEERLSKIRKHLKTGSVIVFHDSQKAYPQLQNELPVLLNEWSEMNFSFGLIH
jgi:peptidoglycan-N-acetylglucosamine deacetylase